MSGNRSAKEHKPSAASGNRTQPFIQPRLKVGQPGDKYEKEADQMADHILESGKAHPGQENTFFSPLNPVQLKTDVVSNPLFQPSMGQTTEKVEEEEAQLKSKSESEPQNQQDQSVLVDSKPAVTEVQTKTETEDELQKMEEEEEAVQAKEIVQKSTDLPDEEKDNDPIQTKSDQRSGASAIESTLNSTTGGSSLESDTRSEMESGFGADFSDVKIHTGNDAVQMSQKLNAQAFTHGNDIYFNEGKYNPGSDSGKHLLAHELTHTVQQGASLHRSMIQKEENEESTADDPEDILKRFYLPGVKARHLQLYQTWASQGKLQRFQGYSRGRPNQVRIWKNYFWDKMQNTDRLGLHEEFSGVKKIKTPGDVEISGRRRTLLKKLTIANWDKRGRVLEHPLEVDHIVELQVGGWPNTATANEIENMELLDKSSNAAAGSKTRWNIIGTVRDYLEATGESNSQSDADEYMDNNTLVFDQVELDPDDSQGEVDENKYWTRAEIEAGRHLEDLEDLGNIGEPGTPTEFALMTPDDGFLMELFPHEEGILSISLGPENPKSSAVAGMKISNININSNYSEAAFDVPIGNVTANWDLPSDFNAPEGPFQVQLKKGNGQYAGKLGNVPSMGLDFEYLSPIELSGEFGINEDGFFAEGRLTPSVDFLEGAALVVGIRGREVYFNAEYSPSNLNIPVPGLTIDSSNLTMGYSTVEGFGVDGNIEFRMDPIGEGSVTAGFNQRNGLSLQGEINFDERHFGRSGASARIGYENDLWSVGGTLTIPRRKVPGVKTATISVDYSQESGFSASGDAELDIPGIEQGTLEIEYSDEGFSIGGDFNLSPEIPGISGGNISATVAKEEGEEGYSVSISGSAQPDIPGIDSELSVSYENGALAIEGSAAYERGMLSGNVRVGATNRTIDEQGQPTGEPDDTMRVYGGGDLTLQLTPWLEATAGVEFLPNGEMEVSGRIGLPNTVDVFDRREFRRNLFTVPTVEIPIFAIPLGPRSIGLVAQISGGLDFSAGFGPGQLREVYAKVTYNPDHEDETEIHGHGEFAIPADAGLTLRGDLGLGVSVAIASLSGGIELAGTLGLEGEASAMVDLSWSPQTGVILDAEGRIMVNPQFTFDVNAFARASLGIGWFSISETWRHNLVSFSWGPDIQFGVVFPVHYQEDQPFDISFDDIDVIYPDLDVVDMAKDLARDIKDDIFD